MPLINHTDARVHLEDGVALLWRVQGLEGFWPNKLTAEIAARAAFPSRAAKRGTDSMIYFERFWPPCDQS